MNEHEAKAELKSVTEGRLIAGSPSMQQTPHTFRFHGDNQELARITPDGIMHFTVDATDENAAKFVALIEGFTGKKLKGIDVTSKPPVNQ